MRNQDEEPPGLKTDKNIPELCLPCGWNLDSIIFGLRIGGKGYNHFGGMALLCGIRRIHLLETNRKVV